MKSSIPLALRTAAPILTKTSAEIGLEELITNRINKTLEKRNELLAQRKFLAENALRLTQLEKSLAEKNALQLEERRKRDEELARERLLDIQARNKEKEEKLLKEKEEKSKEISKPTQNQIIDKKQPELKERKVQFANFDTYSDEESVEEDNLIYEIEGELKKDNELKKTYPLESFHPSMKKIKLDTDDYDNTTSQIFDLRGLLSSTLWDSLEDPFDKEFKLTNFNFKECNTLAFRVEVPPNSIGWAVNITPQIDLFNSNVFLHFNPRHKKKMLVMTDRQGTWGDSLKKSLKDDKNKINYSREILENIVDVVFYFSSKAILIFANNKFVSLYLHRRDISSCQMLKAIFLAKDGNGNPHALKLHKIWWGHQDLLSNPLLTRNIWKLVDDARTKDPPPSVSNPLIPRTLVVKGIPVTDDLVVLQDVEYTLMNVFESLNAEVVSLLPGQGFGFIRFKKPEDLQPAIDELNNAELEGNSSTFILQLSPLTLDNE